MSRTVPVRVRVRVRVPALLALLLLAAPLAAAWDADLELLDLVDEVHPVNFYEFLGLEQDAAPTEIKKAYRRLSLTLHPDKNKDENAETQFRQLVGIYEVLKDEERRRSYDHILEHGPPDWRQPVFYYRRVRRMSNSELGGLLLLILTVGHYAVLWSIYLEKQLDELLSRKKKEKKKKATGSRPAEGGPSSRPSDRPHWHDILPLKMGVWFYLSVTHLPQTLQDLKRLYQEREEVRREEARQEEERQEEARQQASMREKRTKVKKPKAEFPVYQPQEESVNSPAYEQSTTIDDLEEQVDGWLQEGAKDPRRNGDKVSEWTQDELSLLSRLMGKYPGGSRGRWERIAAELQRPVSEVTSKVKQVKESGVHTPGMVKLSELRAVKSPPAAEAADAEQEVAQDPDDLVLVTRRKTRKLPAAEPTEEKMRGRRQRDFDPTEEEEELSREDSVKEEKENVEGSGARVKSPGDVWTQNQQKLLELALQQFPRGTAERWDRIAKVVPGKTKDECVSRYKVLAELVQRRKQVKS